MAEDVVVDFRSIRTRSELASFLGVELKTLTMYAHSEKSFYSSFDIGKKSVGESRRIYAPSSQLKQIQRRLAEELNESYTPPSCVHGFLFRQSIISNAQCHVGSPAILCLDLRDFFPSITEKRVLGLFKAKPFSFPKEVASTLAGLCCHAGSLPQGAPTSPVLSNMICFRMDKQLSFYAHSRRVYYTRYADDITFSAKSLRAMNQLIDTGCSNKICTDLQTIIERNGFQVNEAKTHFSRRSERQVVTGVIVNRKCNYPREQYRTLRVIFNNWKTKGIEYAARQYVAHEDTYRERLCLDGEEVPSEDAFLRHLRGRLEYYSMIDSVNDTRSTSLERLWTMYYDLTGETVNYAIPARSVLSMKTCYDYAEFPNGKKDGNVSAEGSCFVTSDGYLVTCNHCVAESNTPLELPNDCTCDISDSQTGKTLCSIPVNSFVRNVKHDCAIAVLPDELRSIPVLTVDTINRPMVGQRVRAFGVLYEHGEKVREIDCRIDLAHVDGAQYRVAAPFIKGMSGGPVINQRGKVIGVITKGSTPGDYQHDGYFLWIGEAMKKYTESS